MRITYLLGVLAVATLTHYSVGDAVASDSVTRVPQTPSAQTAATFEDSDAAVHRLLQLANQRLELMSAVAAWKWQHHAPVSVPAREQAVIGQAGEIAVRFGLSRPAVERIFALQVALARDEETRLTQRWQKHGFDYQGRPPDLQAVVRPQLDQLTAQLLRALYLAAPTLSEEGFPSRYAQSASRWLQAPGWSDDRRQQLLEALHSLGAPMGPALARIRAAQVLRIGTTGDYAPFSLEAAGRLNGADIELARALAANLGVRAVFVRTSWQALLADLEAGRFDVAMSGISITPARAAVATFSLPYYTGGKTILARCNEAAYFSSLAALDRHGVTLIVNPGGTNEQFAQAHVHRARVRVFADNQGTFAEILARRADAMITDDAEVELQVQAHPGLCRAMPGTLTHELKAVLMPRDPQLAAAVNQWLRGELTDGRPATLIRTQIRSARGA